MTKREPEQAEPEEFIPPTTFAEAYDDQMERERRLSVRQAEWLEQFRRRNPSCGL